MSGGSGRILGYAPVHGDGWRMLCAAVLRLAFRDRDRAFFEDKLCRLYLGMLGPADGRLVMARFEEAKGGWPELGAPVDEVAEAMRRYRKRHKKRAEMTPEERERKREANRLGVRRFRERHPERYREMHSAASRRYYAGRRAEREERKAEEEAGR